MASKKGEDQVDVEYRGGAGTFNLDDHVFVLGSRARVTREQFDRARRHHGDSVFVELEPGAADEDGHVPAPGTVVTNAGAPARDAAARSADPTSPVA